MPPCTCQDELTSLDVSRDEADRPRLGSLMEHRRFEHRAYWVVDRQVAREIADTYARLLSERRAFLLAHPAALTPDALEYGRMRFDRQPTRGKRSVEDYAAETQAGVEAADRVAPPRRSLLALHTSAGAPGLDRADLGLRLHFPKDDMPEIAFGADRVIFGVAVHTGLTWPAGINRVPLFTPNRKMGCPSFSLPAGPPHEGGSCLGSMLPVPSGTDSICRSCYALRGTYTQPGVVTYALLRRSWVLDRLATDPSGTGLAEDLTLAIRTEAGGWFHKSGAGALSREESELGTWHGGRLHLPTRARQGVRLGPVVLSPDVAPEQVHAEAARLRPHEGDVAGYMRVHDSGDFTPGRPSVWRGYINAWVAVVSAFPSVRFWFPSRVPMVRSGAGAVLTAALVDAVSTRPNMIVRPSSLWTGAPTPHVAGLAEGTTSQWQGRSVSAESGVPVLRCPVYEGKGKTCRETACRTCWLRPDVPISYGRH
jgi:hypothetical protein